MYASFVSWLKKYLHILPLCCLLGFQILALIIFGFLAKDRPLALMTPLSGMVALLILLSGLLPALIKPGMETMIAGCLAIVMASILITPMSLSELPDQIMQRQIIISIPWYLVIRLANGVFLGPLALHLAARFPRRSHLSDNQIAYTYLISLGMLLSFLFSTSADIRILTLVVLFGWVLGLLVLAAWLLLVNSRDTCMQNQRYAQQARILFLCFIFAESPALLRPLSLFLGREIIPYDLMLVTQILIPIGIAYAVLKHDLFGIDRALRRGIAYTVLSVLLITGYFMMTAGLSSLLANLWSQVRLWAAGLGLFFAAIIFEPTHKALQRIVDKALYPERLNFYNEIQSARVTLQRTVDRKEVLKLLTEDLPPKLGVSWASLTLAPQPDVPEIQDTPPVWNAQLRVAGRSLGRYWLGPRKVGLSFENDEKKQLDGLVGQAALALAYIETIGELRELNQDLEQRVALRTEQVLEQQRSLAVYEERRRLARDLHDSVSQSLFSINLSARALRKLVQNEPTSAIHGLSELEKAAKDALKEMRVLLNQLRSVDHQASSYLNNPDWEFEAINNDGCCDLSQLLLDYGKRMNDNLMHHPTHSFYVVMDISPEVMVSRSIAYRVLQIVKEGFHNAMKHSGENRVFLDLKQNTYHLKISIFDEGKGIDSFRNNQQGFGLLGMRERIDEMGGEMQIISELGSGTRVNLQIPTV